MRCNFFRLLPALTILLLLPTPLLAAITLGTVDRYVFVRGDADVTISSAGPGVFNLTASIPAQWTPNPAIGVATASQNSNIDLPGLSITASGSVFLRTTDFNAFAESYFDVHFVIDEFYSYIFSGDLFSNGEYTGHIVWLLDLTGPGTNIAESSPDDAPFGPLTGVLAPGNYNMRGRVFMLPDDNNVGLGGGGFELDLALAPVVANAVPEPSTLFLMSVAMMCLSAGGVCRRRAGV